MDRTSPPISGNALVVFLYWFVIVAPAYLVEIWGNYLAATLHFFSIRALLATLFSVWHRDVVGHAPGDLGEMAKSFILNEISRVFGFVARTLTIALGLLIELVILILGLAALVSWYAAPFLLVFAFSLSPSVPHLALPTFTLPHIPAVQVNLHAPIHGPLQP